MVQVFIFGATGFAGGAVALALRRGGHIVTALVRSAEKGKALAKEEILTVVGDATKAETWVEHAAKADVVIDIADGSVTLGIFNAMEKVVSLRKKGTAKLTFIVATGMWLHGDSRAPKSDLSPFGNTPSLVQFRIEHEQNLLAARQKIGIDVIILRPALLFGGSGSFFGMWFGPIAAAAQQGHKSATVTAKKDLLLATIHKDDLGEAFKLFVEKASVVSQASFPIFDIVTPTPEPLSALLEAFSRTPAINFKGTIEYTEPSNPFEEAMSTTILSSSSRARDLVGFVPKHTSMIAEIEVYVSAWLANAT